MSKLNYSVVSNVELLPPKPIRWAALVAIVQSSIGLLYAAILIVRYFTGQRDQSLRYETPDANTSVALGTAIFFIIVFGTVIAGAVFMMRGRRWGRGPVVMLEILLLPISYYMFVGTQPLLAVVTAASALATLGMLFCGPSVDWAARKYAER